jgi:hypothetical protein
MIKDAITMAMKCASRNRGNSFVVLPVEDREARYLAPVSVEADVRDALLVKVPENLDELLGEPKLLKPPDLLAKDRRLKLHCKNVPLGLAAFDQRIDGGDVIRSASVADQFSVSCRDVFRGNVGYQVGFDFNSAAFLLGLHAAVFGVQLMASSGVLGSILS